jgi:hypothetical protein
MGEAYVERDHTASGRVVRRLCSRRAGGRDHPVVSAHYDAAMADDLRMVATANGRTARYRIGMKPIARLLIAATLFGAMNAGSIATVVFGMRTPKGSMTWTMYRTAATDVCDARFVVEAPDGDLRPLDRFAALGTTRAEASSRVRRLADQKAVLAQGHQLCGTLPRRHQLRVTARCASLDGWVDALRDHPVCAGRAR